MDLENNDFFNNTNKISIENPNSHNIFREYQVNYNNNFYFIKSVYYIKAKKWTNYAKNWSINKKKNKQLLDYLAD